MNLPDDVELGPFLTECVELDPITLDDEFVKIPSLIAYWGEHYARAIRALGRAKTHLKVVEARQYGVITARIEGAGKRATQKVVEAELYQDEEWQQAKLAEVEADSEKSRVGGVLDAMRTKRDMLIQMGADRREQMKHDPTLRGQVEG